MLDVLNWLLQGALVAIATAALLQALHRSRARVRYAVLWLAMAWVVALPIVPSIWAAASPARAAAFPVSPGAPLVSIPLRWWMSSALVFGLWALWSGVSGWRVGRAAMALRRARRACRPFPSDVEARLQCWASTRTRGRDARLMLSDAVRTAAVLGCGSPLIAIAPALVDHLTDDELDRVVIHEWAHVQRRDDLANVAQLFVGIAAGWHPAVWWLNRQIHLEREVACDEVAVRATGSAKRYAACLARLASLRVAALPALPAVAAISSSGLRRRIVRILADARIPPRRAWRLAAACVAVLLCGISLTVGGLRIVDVEASVVLPIVPRLILARAPEVVVPAAVVTAQDTRLRAGPSRRSSGEDERAEAEGRDIVENADITPAPNADVMTTPPLPAETIASRILPQAPGGAPPQDPPYVTAEEPSPWSAAADAGVNVGRSSQKAALATAGVFTRFGKKVAGSF